MFLYWAISLKQNSTMKDFKYKNIQHIYIEMLVDVLRDYGDNLLLGVVFFFLL